MPQKMFRAWSEKTTEELRFGRPATRVSRALRARSVPTLSSRVSPKSGGGCPGECPTGCLRGPGLRSVQKVSRECPRSVKKKHVNFHGFSRNFGGDLFVRFFSPIMNSPQKTHKQNFVTHPVPRQSCKFVCLCVFLS